MLPESAAVNTNGAANAYVPSAKATTRSLCIALLAARAVVCACVMEQGDALEQAVPVPVGET